MEEKRDQKSGILVDQPLRGKVALIIGGLSIDACLLTIFLAHHGADVAIVCHESHAGYAQESRKLVEATGRRCLIFTQANDAVLPKEVVRETAKRLDGLDFFIDFSSQSKGEILPAKGRDNTTGRRHQKLTGFWINVDFFKTALEQMDEYIR